MNELIVFLLQSFIGIMTILAIVMVPYLLFSIFDDIMFNGKLGNSIRSSDGTDKGMK